MADEKRPAMHFRLTPELLARVKAAAVLEGVGLPEFARGALLLRCDLVDQKQEQRERTLRLADEVRGPARELALRRVEAGASGDGEGEAE